MDKRKEGVLPITHVEMTRFNISLQAGVDLVMYAIENHLGGEIFVPKIPSYKIMDVAMAIAPSAKTEITGIRPGEKLHEEMITETDALNTIDIGKYYAILPSVSLHIPLKITSNITRQFLYLKDLNLTPAPILNGRRLIHFVKILLSMLILILNHFNYETDTLWPTEHYTGRC